MFFILTTGRSGSASISKYLSGCDGLVCLHEPDPVLIEEATQYIYREYPHEKMITLLRDTRPQTLAGREYGESNQKLSFIIPAINDAFPDSKFIWLVRDGRNVVDSIYSLGWYDSRHLQDSLWQKTLVEAPMVGDVEHDVWSKMSSFSKCCWYWSFVNRCIMRELSLIDKSRWQIQALERIDYKKLFIFLNAHARNKAIPWANKKRKAKKIENWHEWSPNNKDKFTAICGPLMDELYPGWVADTGQWVDFSKTSIFSMTRHYLQDKLVNAKGKQGLLYKTVSLPVRFIFRRHSTVILDKFTSIYQKLSGEN